MIYFCNCHEFSWIVHDLDTHRKWLSSLIIVDKNPIFVAKSHNFLKKKILRNLKK